MNNQTKIAFYWQLMGICFLVHNLYALSGLFFGKDVDMPDATDDFDLSQVVLLSFVLVINGALVITLWKTLRQVNNQSTNVA